MPPPMDACCDLQNNIYRHLERSATVPGVFGTKHILFVQSPNSVCSKKHMNTTLFVKCRMLYGVALRVAEDADENTTPPCGVGARTDDVTAGGPSPSSGSARERQATPREARP
ncbi:MAG: hypothetical protein KatS3mg077_1229 [Candidatus Binatia bacterium]|nr:MAG: hypothetical protein KatS3mg077_1229 [Candidatus Binatia bacterium]